MNKKTAAAPTTDKREKFVVLANKRLVRAVRSIHGVAKLARPSSYEYTPTDVEKIVGVLEEAVKHLQARFDGVTAPQDQQYLG